MRKVIACDDDGAVIRAATDDELVAGAEAHFRAAHPELAGRLTREEILSLAIPARRGARPASRDAGHLLTKPR